MRRRRSVVAVLAVLLLGLVGALAYARPLLLTGTGYAAHNACAVTLLAGRGEDAPEADLPDNPLVPYLRTGVSRDDGTATSTVLGGLFSQTAYYTPGSGCTLASERPGTARVAPVREPDPTRPWPEGSRIEPAPLSSTQRAGVDAAVDAAFGATPAQAEALNTRAVVVVHLGRIVTERYAPGFTAATPQLGWSMAKSVTNLLAGRLVNQGRLAVTESRLRPEWADGRAQITVNHLLRMTTGLNWDETYDLGTPITRMLYLEPDMGRYAASLPAEAPPDSRQVYSSGTTNILCRVLHERSGLGADMAARLLFDPLGMTSAVFEPDASGHLVCSSYLWATPRDWAKVGQLALQGGLWGGELLIPSTWIEESILPTTGASDEDGLAAHWWINRRGDGQPVSRLMPADAFWAAGHDGQRITVVPSADLVVVRMGLTPSGVETGVDRLVGDVVAALGADRGGR